MSKTVGQIISMVDEIRPNAFSSAVKVAWLNEVEGRIQSEVLLMGPEEVKTYVWETDQNTQVLVHPPYDNLYGLYLAAMIDFGNGEYNKYQNDMAMFNEALGGYIRWFAANYEPVQGDGPKWKHILPQYYLTAYGIAVKNGFVGTEQEWVASLKGDKGNPGDVSSVNGVQPDGAGNVQLTPANTGSAPATHASQHASGGSDPLTPPDIMAEKIYRSFSELGLTVGSETIDSIMSAAAAGEKIRTGITSANAAIYPLSYGGSLIVEKSYYNRALLWYFPPNAAVSKDLWFGLHCAGTWSGWQKLATTDYALPRDGSEAMTGKLKLNGNSMLFSPEANWSSGAYSSAGAASNGVSLSTRYDGVSREFLLKDTSVELAKALSIWDTPSNTTFYCLHTGNKPTGSYTGNGDATSRTIETGGFGHAVLITSNNGMALLTRKSGLYGGSSELNALDYNDGHFADGNIVVASTLSQLNANGVTYTYQVL